MDVVLGFRALGLGLRVKGFRARGFRVWAGFGGLGFRALVRGFGFNLEPRHKYNTTVDDINPALPHNQKYTIISIV